MSAKEFAQLYIVNQIISIIAAYIMFYVIQIHWKNMVPYWVIVLACILAALVMTLIMYGVCKSDNMLVSN